jgi:hypothetical protein
MRRRRRRAGDRRGAAATAETDAVQDATALMAWWAFATMVLRSRRNRRRQPGSAHPNPRARLHRAPITMADPV